MRVERITEVGRLRPLCTASVHLSSVVTLTRQIHEDKARRAGVPPGQCVARADYRLDGLPRCASHAGREALRFLEAETLGADHRAAGGCPLGCHGTVVHQQCREHNPELGGRTVAERQRG